MLSKHTGVGVVCMAGTICLTPYYLSPSQLREHQSNQEATREMMSTTLALVFTALLSLSTANPIQCDGITQCPAHSECLMFDGVRQCLCHMGFQPSKDGSSCLRVVELNQDCTEEGTACRRGDWGEATCFQTTGKCTCPVGFRQSGMTRCVLEAMREVNFMLLGEHCNANRQCRFPRTQKCDYFTGVCKCRSGFVKAGLDIMSAKPALEECIPEGLAIGH